MKALIVCTNQGQYPGKSTQTGIWLNEVTHFFEVLNKKKVLIDIVSPLGGTIPIDPRSKEGKDELNHKYMADAEWNKRLEKSLSPQDIHPSDYRLIYFAGGPGSMWDLPHQATLAAIALEIYQRGGHITAVGHGVAGLLPIMLDHGVPFIADKYLTGFTNLEDKLVSFLSDTPFSLEDSLKQKGAHFTKSVLPFLEHIELDERLITGQNPQSAYKVASKAVEELFEK
ncbi:putative intracellular protease/amidase [Dyadobacter jejuensis]|uniref:Putative intracellular protease/amidase n=1 Tax=Dyadobacter jejuensis TaxID=1082580 RepID=A0A316AIR0_9BACT|nr:type 1 glutamine amidotransferase domain-containing protein [Dyadobacter jejuensis]PWJ57158.1 putative intracellular protease/amidase [Dyadobacter jejuensis]